MDQFDKLNIKYNPLPIGASPVKTPSESIMSNDVSEEDLINEEIGDKLLNHLNLIQDFRDRIDAINYLIDSAAKLAGNPEYTTSDKDIIRDIATLGGHGNKVDFELFKKAIAIVINGYEQMAAVSITGVLND